MAANPFGIFAEFFGNSVSTAAGFGIGAAIANPLHPLLQELTNTSWDSATQLGISKPPPAMTLALGVAQGQVDPKTAFGWAHQNGYTDQSFQALIDVANVGPGMAQAYRLWRRGFIDQAGFRRAVQRLGLEQEWIDDLWAARQEVLDQVQLANAIHRGLIPDPGLLVVPPPVGTGNVPAYPVYPIDALAEAQAAGLDKDHLGVLVGLTGLPMGSHEAAQATFRGILTPTDYERAIAEGNTRNEWGQAIFEQSRQIPTAHDGIEGRLRGWLTDPEMYAQTARHGMSQADTDLIFKVLGRPLSFHQVFIGERRGGVYNGPTSQIDPAFLKSLQESNIRPEWYDLAWAQRYAYPTAFVLRSLTEAHDLTQAEAEQILLFEGWEPTLAHKVSTKWASATATGTGAKVDPWLQKAHSHLWTAVQKGYIGGTVDQPNATQSFGVIGIDPAVHPAIFAAWEEQKRIEAL